MSQRTAILLLAHGTPDKLSEMAEYLQKVTGGRPMPQEVIEELQHRYAQIGLTETKPGLGEDRRRKAHRSPTGPSCKPACSANYSASTSTWACATGIPTSPTSSRR